MKKLSMQELDRLTVDQYKSSKKFPVVIVLDNIRSQHNIGSIFRTADAFRLTAIHLCGITATPPSREIHKSALGATESVDWAYFSTTKESVLMLKNSGYSIVAVEQAEGSLNVNDFKPAIYDKIALIFGNEVNGVSDEIMEICDTCIEIPQYGTKHSLNVSVSAGITIYQICNKLVQQEK